VEDIPRCKMPTGYVDVTRRMFAAVTPRHYTPTVRPIAISALNGTHKGRGQIGLLLVVR
jgi:hypothetical protein